MHRDETPAWTIEAMPRWQQETITRAAGREDKAIADSLGYLPDQRQRRNAA